MKNFETAVMDFLTENVKPQVGKICSTCSLKPDAVYKWFREERSPQVKSIGPIMDHFGVTLNVPGQTVRDFKRLLQIQASDVAAWRQEKTAGHPVPESVLAYLLARKHLNSDICFSAALLETLGVEGQSALIYIFPDTDTTMKPTLQGGDQLLVDTRRKEVEDTQLYLIEDNGFKVRRLVSNFGNVIMSADSPSYDNAPLQKSENGQYPIVGQVVWIGKSLA